MRIVDENNKVQWKSETHKEPFEITFQKDEPCLSIRNKQDQVIWNFFFYKRISYQPTFWQLQVDRKFFFDFQ